MLKCVPIFIFLLLASCSKEEGVPENKQVATVSQPSDTATEPEADTNPESEFSIDYLTGKFDPAQHVDFIKVDRQYADREGLYLRKDTYESFIKMHTAAAADGIKLVIRSATRNFVSQKGIWEAKWTGVRKIENGKNAQQVYPDPKTRALKILEYSSMPGTSRHHWGTDIDLNNFNNEWFESGEGLSIYNWLEAHAAEFGFCQPYTEKGAERPDGYNEERWHWSYMPVSQKLTEQARTQLKNEQISGFKGSETAVEIQVVRKYVLGINQDCLPD